MAIPNTINLIDEGAFYVYRGLEGELVIPNSVKTIGDGAFQHCDDLKSIKVPNSHSKDVAYFLCVYFPRIALLYNKQNCIKVVNHLFMTTELSFNKIL